MHCFKFTRDCSIREYQSIFKEPHFKYSPNVLALHFGLLCFFVMLAY